MLAAVPSLLGAVAGGGALSVIAPGRIAAALTVSRASTALAIGTDGTWSSVAADVPRFQRVARRLLLEGARTNLVIAPRNLDHTSWVKTRATVTANASAAPTGATEADRVVPTTASGAHYVGASIAFVSGVTYTFSVIVRAAGTAYPWMRAFLPATAFAVSRRGASFNVATGAPGLVEAEVQAAIEALPDGLFRCSVTATATATASGSAGFGINATDNATFDSYAGNGTDGHDYWGAQMEAGAFATTPVLPPAGTFASATRAAESASLALAASSGTIVLRAVVPQAAPGGTDQGLLQFDDATDANRLVLRVVAGSASLDARTIAGGTTLATLAAGPMTPGTPFRAALAWSPAGTALCVTGGTVQASAQAPPAGLSRLLLGHGSAALDRALHGEIEFLNLQAARLPDAHLLAFANP